MYRVRRDRLRRCPLVLCAPTLGRLQAGEVAAKVDSRFAGPIKALIEEEPSFGYRTVAWLLGFNKNAVQRIFQIKGWQVRKRSVEARPRIEALPSVVQAPNERWSTDLARIWPGKDGWATLALVMDCDTSEFLGWHLSRSGKATTAVSALEHALTARFGTSARGDRSFILRSDNGLAFASRAYTAMVRCYGLKQEFIKPHCPQQNGMMERLIRSLEEQSGHHHLDFALRHPPLDLIRFVVHSVLLATP